ncbi:class I SAM-dependent methyltransferase [Francisella salimarina]|uniref:Class I SAM-dependent methyltransferase n=1 Tax=Francisella salimarina TaxID=2599927 RepID=A0AAJ4NPG6_9GAMM|nr:class I SAM-dependent methyltransferase [Francisella salimarina]QWU99346.1 class I SAM-dependent methyltransferase [Francisella salimarina]
MKCRFCNDELKLTFADLGSAPPSNSYLNTKIMDASEKWFPLKVLVCENCKLVQTQDFAMPEEFFNADYAYFSSFSSNWLKHAEKYVNDMIDRFDLNENSHVIEVAANDGYLLQFVKKANINCTGIEPTSSTASEARKKGIDIIENFFTKKLAESLAEENKQADLIVANNVLAHVPDINDFVSGFTKLLKPNGVATFEFPHLMNLIDENQFDTIYHEHFSYLSLTVAKNIFEANGLNIFDVEKISTHGGSLRVFVQRYDAGLYKTTNNVLNMLEVELKHGVKNLNSYTKFQKRVDDLKNNFLLFLIEAEKNNKLVCGYGAAAKGNTLLNYAGVRPDLIPFIADLNHFKQNKFAPGSRIPIVHPERLKALKPDYIVIFPWNIKEEIIAQLSYVREWGCKFVTAIPELKIF